VTILLGDGMGGFTQPSSSPVGAGANPNSVAVGDFNLDGKPDLATANFNSGDVTILLGNGMGGFTQPAGSPVGAGAGPSSVAVGDFNLDGKPDLAPANAGGNDVTILLNTCSNAPPTDTLPPVITLRLAIELWPPNHKYHIITIAQMVQSVSDDSDGNLFNNVVIERVTSDEPDDASRKADGTTINDIVIAGDCKSVRLRSERDGKQNGRVYSVTLRVGDSSGNVTRRDFKVSVPHDRGAPAVEDATAMTITSNCP
jgi:FG-GAP-like repeat